MAGGILRRRRRQGGGSLFQYTAGDGLPAGSTFARASGGAYNTGLANPVAVVGNNVLRDGHFIGAQRTTLTEPPLTAVTVAARDLTNAAWTPVNMAAALNQTGIIGDLNAASTITATAANATILQAIVLAISQRAQSAYVKRVTGAGVVQMTMDGGATWTAVAVTAAWTRVTIPTQNIANPNIGFRLVTNGDAIAVDVVQNEAGFVPTSANPAPTLGVTRLVDALVLPFAPAPQAMNIHLSFIEQGTITTAASTPFWLGNGVAGTAAKVSLQNAGGVYRFNHSNGAATVASAALAAPNFGDLVALRCQVNADGSIQLFQSLNGAAEVAGVVSAANALAGAWSAQTIYLGGGGAASGVVGPIAFLSCRIASGLG